MYSLNTNAARKADSIGGMINEIGKYVGIFTQAEDVTASTGTRGIALKFVASTGQKANLAIYTQGADGKQYMGFDTLMAMMTCLSLREIKPQQGTVTRWDNETNTEVKQSGKIFPELQGKPIGVLLETEDYTKKNGDIGTRMVLKAVFQANTELTASEILDKKTQPEQLARMVQGLRHRPIKGNKKPSTSTHSAPTASTGGSGFDDMDDDIPF